MQPPDKLWAEIGLSIEKYLRRADRAGDQRIDGDDPSLPFWVEQIPVRFDLRRPDHFGVEGNFAAPGRAFENKNIATLRIIVMMFALIPSRRIDDIREPQQRLDGLQDFCSMKARQR